VPSIPGPTANAKHKQASLGGTHLGQPVHHALNLRAINETRNRADLLKIIVSMAHGLSPIAALAIHPDTGCPDSAQRSK
jgi:hypothetical protein